MDKIWANRLAGGTKTWDEVPAARQPGVLNELRNRVQNGVITPEQFKAITGSGYEESPDAKDE